MYKKDTSISEYRKYVVIRDSISEIFATYIDGYGLADKLNSKEIERLTNKFEQKYKKYIMDTFVELDIQITEMNGTNVIIIDELMVKVAGVVASKLAAELLMIELVNIFVHNKK
jgi:phage tail tube protein FII